MVERKKTSIRIYPQVWAEVKKLAIDEDKTVSQFMEDLLRKEIRKRENEKREQSRVGRD